MVLGVVSAEKTSTQVVLAFTQTLAHAGLDELLDHRLLATLRSGRATSTP